MVSRTSFSKSGLEMLLAPVVQSGSWISWLEHHHTSAHSSLSSAGPGQGSSFLSRPEKLTRKFWPSQVLCLVLSPRPHSALHSLQGCHSLQYGQTQSLQLSVSSRSPGHSPHGSVPVPSAVGASHSRVLCLTPPPQVRLQEPQRDQPAQLPYLASAGHIPSAWSQSTHGQSHGVSAIS